MKNLPASGRGWCFPCLCQFLFSSEISNECDRLQIDKKSLSKLYSRANVDVMELNAHDSPHERLGKQSGSAL
jgi:hypothetical protein